MPEEEGAAGQEGGEGEEGGAGQEDGELGAGAGGGGGRLRGFGFGHGGEGWAVEECHGLGGSRSRWSLRCVCWRRGRGLEMEISPTLEEIGSLCLI